MIYLDNAATTPMDPEVFQAMLPYLKDHFGNPSSIHTQGREMRSAIEKSRKVIANLLNAAPSEIFFTSGGTEADNTAIQSSIEVFNIRHAITSPIEHHAVLHCLESLAQRGKISLSYVAIGEDGSLDMDSLEQLLQKYPNALVSLMQANNELGNLNDINAIGELCYKYAAIYHSDTVQSMGHYRHNLQEIKADFLVGSAHKFHGPKGVGFLYAAGKRKIMPLIHGGSQERNMRGGTENVYGIIGLAKALELAYTNMETHHAYIQGLKSLMITKLRETIPGVKFNGNIQPEQSLYTVLNVSLPESDDNDMLLFNLDIRKISASGGSACSSGSDAGSHVLNALNVTGRRGNVRFSFSKYNTQEEVENVVAVLAEMYSK